MKNIIPYLLVCFITLTLPGCWKEPRLQCETWEYYDECTAKTAGVQNCSRTANTDGNFCLEDLKGITAGGTRKIYEDGDRIVVRHFVVKKS
jgi:hypothetical protein